MTALSWDWRKVCPELVTKTLVWRRLQIFVPCFPEQCYDSVSVRTEMGVSSTRPTKQDSASGRSVSLKRNSKFRKYDSKWNKAL